MTVETCLIRLGLSAAFAGTMTMCVVMALARGNISLVRGRRLWQGPTWR